MLTSQLTFFLGQAKLTNHSSIPPALLEKFWRITLYLTDDANAKLYVT